MLKDAHAVLPRRLRLSRIQTEPPVMRSGICGSVRLMERAVPVRFRLR